MRLFDKTQLNTTYFFDGEVMDKKIRSISRNLQNDPALSQMKLEKVKKICYF